MLGPLRGQLRRQLALFVPLAITGLLLMAYNWARFRDPLEFGLHYQMGPFDFHSKVAVFDFARFRPNLEYYLIEGGMWLREFPYLYLAPLIRRGAPPPFLLEQVAGLFWLVPVTRGFVLLPLVRAGRGFAWLCLGCAAVMLLPVTLLPTATQRYLMDFGPALFLATVPVVGQILGRSRWLAIPRLGWRALLVACAIFSLLTMTLAGMQGYEQRFRERRPDLYRWLNDLGT